MASSSTWVSNVVRFLPLVLAVGLITTAPPQVVMEISTHMEAVAEPSERTLGHAYSTIKPLYRHVGGEAKHYTFRVGGEVCTVKAVVPTGVDYQHLWERSWGSYLAIIEWEGDDAHLAMVERQLEKCSERVGAPYYVVASLFVQQLDYDYGGLVDLYEMKGPLEVLRDSSGVCSEKSVLLAHLLKDRGYEVALIEFYDADHMGVGVGCNRPNVGDYCYIESTELWSIGDMPEDFEGEPYRTIKVGDGKEVEIRVSREAFLEKMAELLREEGVPVVREVVPWGEEYVWVLTVDIPFPDGEITPYYVLENLRRWGYLAKFRGSRSVGVNVAYDMYGGGYKAKFYYDW